ncbi:restriction endonuclease [Candidatus Bathyarchaeota archaeon]|nr:restriction endonuclease [Candidatus Bathyarchaeota archaeon]
MAVFVTKADGKKQQFIKEKVIQTCMRMGATRELAKTIAKEIENKSYNGISTSKILQMIFSRLRKHKPIMKYHIDLRRSLSLMKSAPDFERFIQLLLSEHNYHVSPNQIIQGRCIEHEVDGVAKKDGKTYIVEVKHHYKFHTPTSLDVSRIARAILEDLTEGYNMGLNNLKVDNALIVCNTKLSEHAKRYADCRGILHIGWSSGSNRDLQTMIEEKKLYPITFLKGLKTDTRNRLASDGIVMLKQLTQNTISELRSSTGISKQILSSILDSTMIILEI